MELTALQTQWVNETWEKLTAKMEQSAPRNREKLPYTAFDGVFDDYSKTDANWWTNGFWPGLNWLLYVGTKNEIYRDVAQNGEKLLDEALRHYTLLHHDVGFMWQISAATDYALTGSEASKMRALYAASTLASRYHVNGKFIRAWNGEGQDGWAIIDCMMNLLLLYWASKETGDTRFAQIAMQHADTTMAYHVRADGSVKHIVEYDLSGGGAIGEPDGQGYAEHSSWSRGQAWALYGFALSYLPTEKPEYFSVAKRVAHYFIACVCDDWLPKCDFRSPAEPVIYDSTAGAIAACGLLEIAKAVPKSESAPYLHAAMQLLQTMEAKFCDWNTATDSIVQMGTERYHAEKGRHIPIIYGDYFFAEAIYKLKAFTPLFW